MKTFQYINAEMYGKGHPYHDPDEMPDDVGLCILFEEDGSDNDDEKLSEALANVINKHGYGATLGALWAMASVK